VLNTLNHDAGQAPKRASELMAQVLIEEIRSGMLPVGDALPTERELCDRFDASRPTVREALVLMQSGGYISTAAGKRPRADKPTIENIILTAGDHIREILGQAESGAHLEQMRQFVETGAVREAARKASNVQITLIRNALSDNFAAIGSETFPQTDIAFHRSIVAVVDNPIILTLHDRFVSVMLASRPALVERQQHDETMYEEHRCIYEAILRGDMVEATDIMDRHLERSYRSRLAPPQKIGVDGVSTT